MTRKACEGIDRRQMLVSSSLVLAASLSRPGFALAADPASERPKEGDRLVIDDQGEHHGKPARVELIPLGGPLVAALPVDSETGTVRGKSRFNKLQLIRLPIDDIEADSRKHAADGVLAFSAICTHQACTISGWKQAERTLACFCHHSEFSAAEGGRVVNGPAKRRLPILPLSIGEDGELIVAAGFTAKPGVKA